MSGQCFFIFRNRYQHNGLKVFLRISEPKFSRPTAGEWTCLSLGYKWEDSHRLHSGTPPKVAILWDQPEWMLGRAAIK